MKIHTGTVIAVGTSPESNKVYEMRLADGGHGTFDSKIPLIFGEPGDIMVFGLRAARRPMIYNATSDRLYSTIQGGYDALILAIVGIFFLLFGMVILPAIVLLLSLGLFIRQRLTGKKRLADQWDQARAAAARHPDLVAASKARHAAAA